jgi:hypothetical protein
MSSKIGNVKVLTVDDDDPIVKVKDDGHCGLDSCLTVSYQVVVRERLRP